MKVTTRLKGLRPGPTKTRPCAVVDDAIISSYGLNTVIDVHNILSYFACLPQYDILMPLSLIARTSRALPIIVKREAESVSTQHTAGTFPGAQLEMQRTTGKLLATQGYVVGIEISGSGSRQSVALADLNGSILHRVRRPLEYIPDTETVLHLLDDMLAEVMHPEQLQ